MNTIEMLTAVIKNGGAYFHGTASEQHVKLDINGIVSWHKNNDGRIVKPFELRKGLAYWQWEPYIGPIDWLKIPIDTKVLCKAGGKWYGRHFSGVYCGKPAVWDSGCTSHSTHDKRFAYEWEEIKLVEE